MNQVISTEKIATRCHVHVFFVLRTEVVQCFWDLSSCWNIICKSFISFYFILYPKATLVEKRFEIVLIIWKKFSRLTNRGVIENNRIGFDFWKCFWIRNIQSWRDISSRCKSSKVFHFLYHVSLWGRNYRIICYSKADHIADNGKRSWKGVNDLSLL